MFICFMPLGLFPEILNAFCFVKILTSSTGKLVYVIHGTNIPSSYEILSFILSDFTSITSHIHNWLLSSLWLCLVIHSGVNSSFFCSSILGTYIPGEFIFQCHIFFPFHTAHSILKARILKWFDIPFSSGPHFFRTFHHDMSVLGGPTWHAS